MVGRVVPFLGLVVKCSFLQGRNPMRPGILPGNCLCPSVSGLRWR